jgi:hypothetical protein
MARSRASEHSPAGGLSRTFEPRSQGWAFASLEQGLSGTPRVVGELVTEQRVIGTRASALAATSHNSGRQALPCCGGGDGPDHRRVRYSFSPLQGGRRRMRRDLRALVLSLGGLLAVTGSALLVLWAVIN